MGSFSISHWLVFLLIVAIIFGTKKLRNLGSDLGCAIKGFKEGLNDLKTSDQIGIENQSKNQEELSEKNVK